MMTLHATLLGLLTLLPAPATQEQDEHDHDHALAPQVESQPVGSAVPS